MQNGTPQRRGNSRPLRVERLHLAQAIQASKPNALVCQISGTKTPLFARLLACVPLATLAPSTRSKACRYY